MNIRIGKYGIRSSSDCFVVYVVRKIEPKKEGQRGKAPLPENIGKEVEYDQGYYGKLEHCLDWILEQSIQDSEVNNIDQLKQLVSKTKEEMKIAVQHMEQVLLKAENRYTELEKQLNDLTKAVNVPEQTNKQNK